MKTYLYRLSLISLFFVVLLFLHKKWTVELKSKELHQLDVSTLSGGIYFLKINNETPIKILIE